MASTPGSAPSPNATTKIRAKTMSGTVRLNSSRRRMTNRTTADRLMLRLANSAPITAPTRPVTVPT